jgi:hypothetical protein
MGDWECASLDIIASEGPRRSWGKLADCELEEGGETYRRGGD